MMAVSSVGRLTPGKGMISAVMADAAVQLRRLVVMAVVEREEYPARAAI